MGVDTYIKGLRDLDGKFAEMLKFKKQCDKLKIKYPKEVLNYFENEEHGNLTNYQDEYIQEHMQEVDLGDAVKELNECDYEIDVKKIPKEVKKIKVYRA